MNDTAAPQGNRNRNRFTLLAIFAVFFGAFALAGILRFSGWRPAGLKNHGELLQPPADLRAVLVHEHAEHERARDRGEEHDAEEQRPPREPPCGRARGSRHGSG